VAYVYRIYGLHWCVNAVTRETGHGSAVLLRAVEPLAGMIHMRARRGAVPDWRLARGPGNLCQAFGISSAQDGVSLSHGALRILAGDPVPESKVAVTARIGITQAADWPLRFFVRDSPFVSGSRQGR
jgi:DNA-3-methyladenine glycosylase